MTHYSCLYGHIGLPLANDRRFQIGLNLQRFSRQIVSMMCNICTSSSRITLIRATVSISRRPAKVRTADNTASELPISSIKCSPVGPFSPEIQFLAVRSLTPVHLVVVFVTYGIDHLDLILARGYSIVSADDIAGACEIAKGCPIHESGGTVEVAEIMGM